MAEAETGTRSTDESARVRGYLTTQAAKLSVPQIVDKVRESQEAVLAAAAAVPSERFSTPPADGEWSASEVLYHVLTVIGDHSRAVISAIRTGTPTPVRPDRLEHLNREVSLDEVRGLLAAEREELFDVVLAADPEVNRDVITFRHPAFGSFTWRETLLFVRVHDLDHVRQLQGIAAALGKA